jgi:hemerythrin-like domain-containing protein
MRPTEILSNEHRVIEILLQCLDRMTEEAERTGSLEKEPAEQALEFIRNFADGCHHGKEEVHLFPAMEEKGVPREGGPIGVMLHDHETGRGFVRGMSAQVNAASEGDPAALAAFAANARGYINLLVAHIQKEDHVLFPLADRAFSDDDQQALLAAFDKVEVHDMGEGTHEKYLDIARSLAKRYGVPSEAIEKAGCTCNHHKQAQDA